MTVHLTNEHSQIYPAINEQNDPPQCIIYYRNTARGRGKVKARFGIPHPLCLPTKNHQSNAPLLRDFIKKETFPHGPV